MGDHLPPLPTFRIGTQRTTFSADEMRAYALEAVKQEREAAFEAGWRTAANWVERDDLIADIGSPAYLADRAAVIRARSEQGSNG